MAKRAFLIVIASAVFPSSIAAESLQFSDHSNDWGLSGPLKSLMSHAAACGDIDGDGDLDLYVGAFCDRPPEQYLGRSGPVPNILLINEGAKYIDSGQDVLALKARTSGAVFVDLDNDGDLDLYVSNNSKAKGLRLANKLFENINGRFHDVSAGNKVCVIMGGRSIGVLDYNADGLLDLLVAEDKWTGGRTRLFANMGRLKFEDVSEKAGLPRDLPGLGVITPDLNGDGQGDIFISQANRLFLSKEDGTYREGDSSVFQYEPINREASPAGVSFGDLNRDGRMDIVIVDHSQPARQHLFLNLGLSDGAPLFEEVTKQADLDYQFPSWTPEKLHLKHAHVEIADTDNDGWPDICVAATYRSGGEILPFICRNITAVITDMGLDGVSMPHFEVPPVDKADAYFSAGPVADFNRDGTLDIFLASWFPQIPSRLFLNENNANHWLQVKVVGGSFNRMGIGSKVKVYPAGKLGEANAIVGYQEIGTGFGFCSGQEATAHFGLGKLDSCDVEIILPHGKGTIHKKAVKSNQLLIVREAAGETR